MIEPIQTEYRPNMLTIVNWGVRVVLLLTPLDTVKITIYKP